jgi:hypothetical protein
VKQHSLTDQILVIVIGHAWDRPANSHSSFKANVSGFMGYLCQAYQLISHLIVCINMQHIYHTLYLRNGYLLIADTGSGTLNAYN